MEGLVVWLPPPCVECGHVIGIQRLSADYVVHCWGLLLTLIQNVCVFSLELCVLKQDLCVWRYIAQVMCRVEIYSTSDVSCGLKRTKHFILN